MADANKITQQTQNIKNLIYQLRGDYAKDLNEKQALQAQLAQQKAAGDFSNWFTNFRNSKINEFYNWQQNEGKNPEYSGWKIDDYLNYKYSGDIATKRSKYGIEQQYLDQQKAINKAVGELNNNIIKLFLKMMS